MRRFALLINSLHSETKRSSVEILVGECSLYSNYLVQLFLFGVGTVFPQLFLKRCGEASFVETTFPHLFF